MSMLRLSWVYSLRKEDLQSICSEFQLNPASNMEELRKQVTQFINNEQTTECTTRLLELQEKYENISILPKFNTSTQRSPLKAESSGTTSTQKLVTLDKRKTQLLSIIDVVRNWGLKYDGGKDPLLFLERADEMAAMYNINKDLLPCIMPEFLLDRALC